MNLTTQVNNHPVTGKATVTAKAAGKQRTVPYDHARTGDANHGAAAGTLLNVLLDKKQQAKLRHPSGKQRVTFDQRPGERGKRRWTFDV